MTLDIIYKILDPSYDVYISNSTYPLLSGWISHDKIGGDYIKKLDVVRISSFDTKAFIVTVIDNNPNFKG